MCKSSANESIVSGKFRLNSQGVYNTSSCFLDISISHSSSISDYLAFVTSSLNTKLETNSFLALNLVLFGDNTCVSNSCIVVPCKNVSSGSEDDFNFYIHRLELRQSAYLVC